MLKSADARRLAGLEINALTIAGTLPSTAFDGTRIHRTATPVYDVNGELLFHRIPVARGNKRVGFSDLAANEALGGPLLAVSYGVDWNQAAIKKTAIAMARKRKRGLKFTQVRFVAYSYPKIAIQFLQRGKEVLMLELWSWKPVPAAPKKDRRKLEPTNFERWSLLDELPVGRKRANLRKLSARIELWDKTLKRKALRRLRPELISTRSFAKVIQKIALIDTWEVHYSKRPTDHHVCYEVRGQETSVWCVGASVQMLLDFYRYGYTQTRLATELGLGTKSNPNGLPYSRVGDVVTVVEDMSSNSLDCTMVTGPGWSTFRGELRQNRPLISFVPGHSRTVVGYTRSLLRLPGQLPFRGLLVYDPWPPNQGTITRWENFDTQTYQFAYTSAVTLA